MNFMCIRARDRISTAKDDRSENIPEQPRAKITTTLPVISIPHEVSPEER